MPRDAHKREADLPAALADLQIQPRVRDYLATAVCRGRLSHAYLFVGAPGSGKTEAALALAQCLVCPDGGCGACDECIRVARRSHPDVRVLEPESVTGYLIDQVRELIDDAPLAPVRGRAKVYVLTNAGLLRGRSANALLKTIEEPPAGVTFILCARTTQAVLPTIVSRCQEVPFRIVSPEAATRSIQSRVSASDVEAHIALAVAGTPDRAVLFLTSPERRQVRRLVVRTLGELATDDGWDVLTSAKALVASVMEVLGYAPGAKRGKGGKDDPVERELRERLEGKEDYLSRAAVKQMEKAVKRELTARERSGMMEALAAAQTMLRDVLVTCEQLDRPLVNADVCDIVRRIAASTTTAGVLHALEAVARAEDDISHNVTPQLAIEVMLFRIKEALTCPPSYR